MTDYTSAEFWRGAPEGATHYLPADAKRSWAACWYKQDQLGQWLGLNASNHEQRCYDEWVVDNDQVDAFTAALIPRPTQPWSGDGLPPVGTVCNLRGKPVEVLGYGKVRAFLREMDSGDEWAPRLAGLVFTPIKTPAQIAAEEREEAIEAMMVLGIGNPSRQVFCASLYDAGLRFPKGDDK